MWIMISKMHAMLLSAFSLCFKFPPRIHISVYFIKSWAVASIPRFFVCMCCAAMKHCLANNVLGISSRIKLLFPPADAASMLFIGHTIISGICVALALCIAVPRGSKNNFFNYACLRYAFSLTVINIIMNWFQSTQGGGQTALQYVASGVIDFVAVHCLWNVEVKQGDNNQPMSEVWDWNIYGTKLKFDGWFLNTADKDGDGGDDGDDEDGDGGDDGDGEDGDGGEDDATFSLEDIGREIVSCARAVQLLSIRANFRVSRINACDWTQYTIMYVGRVGKVQEVGMDLVLHGPYRMLEAYGKFALEVFAAEDEGPSTDDEGSSTRRIRRIYKGWDVRRPEEVEEFTRIIYGGLGRKLLVTYLVIPEAVETHVEVRLNLKDLGLKSRAVYGSVKSIAIDYGSKSVHHFSCDRGKSVSLPCGSACILPLVPNVIALPYLRHFELQIEVDLRVITTCDSQEDDKNLKFCLDCSRRIRSEERLEYPWRIRSQKREVDGDQVEVKVIWHLERTF